MAFDTYTQDPADVLWYPFDWQGGDKPFLAPGIEIVTSEFAAYTNTAALGEPVELTPTDDVTFVDDDFDETTTQALVGIDTANSTVYYVTNHVVASDDQEKDWTIKIKIKEQ